MSGALVAAGVQLDPPRWSKLCDVDVGVANAYYAAYRAYVGARAEAVRGDPGGSLARGSFKRRPRGARGGAKKRVVDAVVGASGVPVEGVLTPSAGVFCGTESVRGEWGPALLPESRASQPLPGSVSVPRGVVPVGVWKLSFMSGPHLGLSVQGPALSYLVRRMGGMSGESLTRSVALVVVGVLGPGVFVSLRRDECKLLVRSAVLRWTPSSAGAGDAVCVSALSLRGGGSELGESGVVGYHSVPDGYRCDACDVRSQTQTVMRLHSLDHCRHESSLVCLVCGVEESSGDRLVGHCLLHVRPWGCSKCHLWFPTVKGRDNHVRTHDRRCHCGFRSADPNRVVRHIRHSKSDSHFEVTDFVEA